MRFVLGLLILSLVWPSYGLAQFTPIDQVRQQGATAEQADLNAVTVTINDKALRAKTALERLYNQVAAGRLSVDAAESQSQTIINNFKGDLNQILAKLAKTNPSAEALRSVYAYSQSVVDDLRNRNGSVADGYRQQKTDNPGTPSGPYLDYQTKLVGVYRQGLEAADLRLNNRGTRTTVLADLNKIVSDTEKKEQILTSAFTATNDGIIESALRRIRNQQSAAFAKAMAERLKSAETRLNDKEEDLSEAELALVEAAKEQISQVAANALNSIDRIYQTVLSSGIPTQIDGVIGRNPLQEAKFRVTAQVEKITPLAEQRINRIATEFAAETTVSALAKEIVAKYATAELVNYKQTVKELETYFSAGDPTRAKYNKQVRNLQKKAEGCNSLLCNIGRVATGVGSALISKSTGGQINIPSEALNKVVGIRDPQVVAGYSRAGISSLPNSRGGCFGSLPSKWQPKLVEVALAQSSRDTDAEGAANGNDDAFSNAGGLYNSNSGVVGTTVSRSEKPNADQSTKSATAQGATRLLNVFGQASSLFGGSSNSQRCPVSGASNANLTNQVFNAAIGGSQGSGRFSAAQAKQVLNLLGSSNRSELSVLFNVIGNRDRGSLDQITAAARSLGINLNGIRDYETLYYQLTCNSRILSLAPSSSQQTSILRLCQGYK
ncbi:MAG: hypothetical protein CEO22_422 [Candidatus Berkelbacteria bacterium Gr01-1014_85]|uniref:Uncharacterized protein n=1 Tax=Candidatus Berkelbacteria bacterium Gr01-1014_85 TaxID=2017150 RepID=A0A554JBA4_9BACT|nr:MAG: hypothetical protein CEO22_422 [Candidatus Berkelbacteria bacterium Gr01-1014_85]